MSGGGRTCCVSGLISCVAVVVLLVSTVAFAQHPGPAGELDFKEIPPSPSDAEGRKLGAEEPAPVDLRAPNLDWGIGGKVQLDIIHDFNSVGLQTDDGVFREFITGQIPIAGPAAERTGRTAFSPNQSRFYGWVGAPTKWGLFQLYAQFNLMGQSDGVRFQVHRLWAHWSWLHIAYDYTQLLNMTTIPNTLDYEGPNAALESRRGLAYLRIPLAQLGELNGWYLSIGAEQSNIDATLPLDVVTRGNVPATVARIIYRPDRADIQVGGMYRRLRFAGGGFDNKINSWAVSFQGSVHFLENDEVIFAAIYGEGLGSYFQDTEGFGLDAAPDGAQMRAIPAFGAWAALTHYWITALSTTVSFGYIYLDNDFDMTPNPVGTYHETVFVSANLIWTPWHAMDTGIEYLYGRRTITANTSVLGETRNDDHRLQFTILFRFEYSREGVEKTLEPAKFRP